MHRSFLIKRGSKEYGPYTVEEARLYLTSGNLVTADLAWDKRSESWVPLREMLGRQEEEEPAPESRPPRPRNAAVLMIMVFVWWFVFLLGFFVAATFFAGVLVDFMNVRDPEEAGVVVGEIAGVPILLGSLGLAVWLTVIGKLPGTRK